MKVLLATPGIDLTIQDSSGQIPLKMATTYEAMAMLKKYTTTYEDYPIHSFGKVILFGDSGAGKSTLVQVITIMSLCVNVFNVLFKWIICTQLSMKFEI